MIEPSRFLAQLRTAGVLVLVFTALCGGAYPLAVTLAAQTAFPYQANGSLINEGDRIVGSELLGQSFSAPHYFWGRPSATTPPYNAAASQGSNDSPGNPELAEAIARRAAALKQDAIRSGRPIPVDMVTASASGLDPHISQAAAELQLKRVAKARRMKEDDVRRLISQNTQPPQFGVLGEPRVHVLRLNLALDKATR